MDLLTLFGCPLNIKGVYWGFFCIKMFYFNRSNIFILFYGLVFVYFCLKYIFKDQNLIQIMGFRSNHKYYYLREDLAFFAL